MTGAYSDDAVKLMVRGGARAIPKLEETTEDWLLGIIKISKQHSLFSFGFSSGLQPESHFSKRWFDDAETNTRGWAVIFRACDLQESTGEPWEFFAGWTTPECEVEVDQWITFLNGEIQKRLAGA
jgi:hypothetical protein